MQMKTMMGLQHTWITMPKSRRLTPPNAGKAAEQCKPSFIADRSANDRATSEDNLAVFYKAKCTTAI
jgi:hypothetical protein